MPYGFGTVLGEYIVEIPEIYEISFKSSSKYFYAVKSDRHLYLNIWIWLLEYFAIFFSKSTKRNAQEVYHSSTEKHNATTEEKEDDDDGSKIVVDKQGDKARSTEKTSLLLAYFFVTIIRSTNISPICGS